MVATPLLIILTLGACVGAWALLSLLGAERQRLLDEAEARLARPQALPASPAISPASSKPVARPRTVATPARQKDAPGRKRGAGGATNAR